MTLTELMKAVDTLSDEEIHRLREYLDQRERQKEPTGINVDLFEEAISELREGFSQAGIEELERAMNVKYGD